MVHHGLPGVLVLDILNGTSALDTTDSKASSITEAADGSSLPLKRGLDGLVKLVGLVEVDNVHPAIGGSNHEKLIFGVHGIDALLALDGSHGLLLTKIPVLDSLVPRTSDEHLVAVDHDALNALDRLVVSSNLLRVHVARTEIHHLGCFVGTGAKHLCSILIWSVGCGMRFVLLDLHTLDQAQLRAGAVRSNMAFPALDPSELIS